MITQIVKLAADNKFHVVGEIIVAHEITMAAAVANLKRILAVCGDRKVYIITPLLRYINEACCRDAGHCTHRAIPDSATKLLLDLGRLHRFIESRLSSFPLCEVTPAGDLLAAKHGASASEVLAAYSGWGAVHGSGAAYTRMALTLVDKVQTGSFKKPPPRRRRLTAAGRGNALSPAPLPVATDLPPAPLDTLVGTSCPASPAAAAAAAAAVSAEVASRPTSASVEVPAIPATTSWTTVTLAAAATAALGPDAAAAMMAATAPAPVAVAATTTATSLFTPPSIMPIVFVYCDCNIKNIP